MWILYPYFGITVSQNEKLDQVVKYICIIVTFEYFYRSHSCDRCGATLVIYEFWSRSWYALDGNDALVGAIRKASKDEPCLRISLSSIDTLGLLRDKAQTFFQKLELE